MKKKKEQNLIVSHKDTGSDLIVKTDKKTGKIYYEGKTTLFDNLDVNKLFNLSLSKNTKNRVDAAINIDTCINIYRNKQKKNKSSNDSVKFLDNAIAPTIFDYLKENEDDDSFFFFFHPDKIDEKKRIEILHKKFKEIDNFYFDPERMLTGKLYAYTLMLYTISLGGIIFKDKIKNVEKIWKVFFKGLKKCKVFNLGLIPMNYRKKYNGWGKLIALEQINGSNYQTIYEGNFINGLFSGKGKWSSKQGRSYEGNFKDGLRHGKGTSISSKGEKLTCNFFNDHPKDGKGELLYINGDKYIGNFKNNNLHGKGIFFNKNKKLKIIAHFENNQPVKILKTIPIK